MKSFRVSKAVYIGIIVFLADFITKYLTHAFIPIMNRYTLWYPYGGIGIFKNLMGIEFSISHATNRGAAWGILAEFQDSLLILRIILVIGMLLYILFFNKNKSWEIPFTLIIVGAAGNISDYFLYGHVIDMLHFVLWGYDFPVFNIADSAIFLGIAWLILLSCLDAESRKKI